MKAVVYEKYGSPEVLKVAKLSPPEIKEDQVLVEIYSSSVNPVDWKIRKGDLKFLTGFKFPRFLGADFSGKVVQTGPSVKGFKAGDDVYGLIGALKGGACAEYLAISEKDICIKPANMSYTEAASVPLAAQTALQGLRDKGQIKKGQNVLINGCSGGVGVFAIQLAKDFGAEVTGVCSGSNIDLAKELGCDDVINYKEEDVTHMGKAFDLIFDAVGLMKYSDAKKILSPNGIYVSTLPSPSLYLKGAFSKIFTSKKAETILLNSNAKDLSLLRNLIENEKLKTVVDMVYSLEQVSEAHAYSEKGHARGKIGIMIRK